jgi:hypothetical protein
MRIYCQKCGALIWFTWEDVAKFSERDISFQRDSTMTSRKEKYCHECYILVEDKV